MSLAGVFFLGLTVATAFFFFMYLFCCYGAAMSHMTNVGSVQTPIVMTPPETETDATLPIFHESMMLQLIS